MTYEEYLRTGGAGKPGGYVDGRSTMTVPASEDYSRTQWGASLSDDELRKLIQAGIDNRPSLLDSLPNQPKTDIGLMERIAGVSSMGYPTPEVNPVFDPKNPIVSETNTQKDNDGNSITTTIKGKYEDITESISSGADAALQTGSDIFDQIQSGYNTGVNFLQDIGSGVNEGYNTGVDFLQDVGGGIYEGYNTVNDYRKALENRGVELVKAINEGGSDSIEKVSDTFDSVSNWARDLPTSNQELAELWGNYAQPLVDQVLHGTTIPDDQDGSEQNIAEAYQQLGEARTIAEKELGLNWDVPGASDVIDAQPNVIAAQEFLADQINAKEKFLTDDVPSVDKILSGIADSETWNNLERIASSLEQSGYRLGDDYTKWAAENPFTAAATMFYGGPIVGKVAMVPVKLAGYLAKKAPWVLKKLKWFVSPGGILVTGAGVEQYFNNEEQIDAWIEENVPKIIHSPINTIAEALTDENVSDEKIVEELSVFELQDNLSSDDEVVSDQAISASPPGSDKVVEEKKPELSVFEYSPLEPIQLEATASNLVETAGANENLDPTVDEAAKVLAETPELIDRMNSLADYMDSTTNEEALAAARQAAIDIENDSSHSDRTSAAAMTFLASMLFGGNLTDSFNAAFTPIGKYYDAKRAAAVKRADEKAAEDTRIRLEKRADIRADEVYERKLEDDKEAAALLAASKIEGFNAEQQAITERHNRAEENKLIIARAKATGDYNEAYLKAMQAEKKRIIQARNEFIKLVTSDVDNDFQELLRKTGKMSIGRQVTSAINEIEKVVSKSLDANGQPRVFDLDEPANRTAVFTAITNYVNDVTAGIDGDRSLTTYMTDMIVKRELEQYSQVIKPEWFTVPVRDQVSTYIPKDADPDDYTYKKLKKRDNINTEKKFAETNKQVYDIIQNVAFDTGTASGNPVGMDAATRYFVKDFQDMQNNLPADFDRLVRNAVKYGVHPFSYFILRYNPKWKIGQQFEK